MEIVSAYVRTKARIVNNGTNWRYEEREREREDRPRGTKKIRGRERAIKVIQDKERRNKADTTQKR